MNNLRLGPKHDTCQTKIRELEEENRKLREALAGMISRFTGLFNGYVRDTYSSPSGADDDLRLTLVDARAALADKGGPA